MELEEAIDICKNKICDDVISAYCEKKRKYCKEFCENEDCYLIQAIETVLQALEDYKTHNDKYMNGELFSAKQMKFIEKEYIPKKKIDSMFKIKD